MSDEQPPFASPWGPDEEPPASQAPWGAPPPPGQPWATPAPGQAWGAPPSPYPGWPQQQWQAYPPYPGGPGWSMGPQPVNPWAVVALVTGVLPLFPVAIPAGIVGIVQTRDGRKRGRGMAVAGVVLGGFWALVVAALVVAGLTGAFGPYDPLGRVADAGSTSVGTCVYQGAVVGCDQPHDEEVYRVTTLGAGAWPGADEVAGRADDVCYGTFKAYVGSSYESSDLEYDYYAPDAQEWRTGEHRVVCVVEPGSPGDVEEGSARRSGR